jgi:DNA-binding CsgD family transcriptional regulator
VRGPTPQPLAPGPSAVYSRSREWVRNSSEQRSRGADVSKSRQLRLGDVRAALRLVGECRDLGYDHGRWAPHMLAGLCRLLGARAGNGGEIRLVRSHGSLEGAGYFDAGFAPGEGALYLEFLNTRGLYRHPGTTAYAAWRAAAPRPGRMSTKTRRQVVPDPEWYGSAFYNECHRVIRIDHCLGSVRELAPGGLYHGFNLYRATGEPDFSGRQQRLLHLFHAELGRLIGPVLVSPTDPSSPTRLPPRVRETLSCLMEGDGEKQAAARMGLSVPTVHQYVTALYRHYRVASRAELLTRVLRRPSPPTSRPGSRPPWTPTPCSPRSCGGRTSSSPGGTCSCSAGSHCWRRSGSRRRCGPTAGRPGGGREGAAVRAAGHLQVRFLEHVRRVDPPLQPAVEAELHHPPQPWAVAGEDVAQRVRVAGGGPAEGVGPGFAVVGHGLPHTAVIARRPAPSTAFPYFLTTARPPDAMHRLGRATTEAARPASGTPRGRGRRAEGSRGRRAQRLGRVCGPSAASSNWATSVPPPKVTGSGPDGKNADDPAATDGA